MKTVCIALASCLALALLIPRQAVAHPTPPTPTERPQAAPAPAAPATPAVPQARPLRLGLRMASPLADGAQVTASGGVPVEPIEHYAQTLEGHTARLTLVIPPPPSSRQRRAPEPPAVVMLDLTARLEGRQAVVQVLSPQNGGAVTMLVPVGVWTDISGRPSWQAGGRQTISSSMARPEAAQILIRVDSVAP